MIATARADENLVGVVEVKIACELISRGFAIEPAVGARADRPELRRMLDQVRDGDVVVISRLDRLARSTRDLLELCEEIDAAGAGLH